MVYKPLGYRKESSPHSAVACVTALAGQQHGVVSTWQMRELGLSGPAINRRVAAGWLHPLYRGVYAVGHVALTRRSRILAAVLAAGTGALSSHRSAGELRDLLYPGPIDVTSPRSRRPRAGFVLHRSRHIADEDRTVIDGIPVTSVARTLVDLAEVLGERRLSNAVHEAEIQKVFDLKAIERVMARVPGRTGRHMLHRVLEAYGGGPQLTRSDYERTFLEICHRHGIPIPHSAVSVAGYELDFLWGSHGLAVEVDDEATHFTTRAYYADRRRDRALVPHGIQVIRVTPRDLENEAELAAELMAILAAKAA